MIDRKHALVFTLLAAPTLLAGASAQASTARQYTSGGEGTYTTSSGLPTNFIGGSSTAQPVDDGARGVHQPRDFEHHGRYFGGE